VFNPAMDWEAVLGPEERLDSLFSLGCLVPVASEGLQPGTVTMREIAAVMEQRRQVPM